MGRTRLTSYLRKELEKEKETMGKRNELQHRGAYISDAFLQHLFTSENIRKQLEFDQMQAPVHDLKDLVTFIETRGRKVFAILVLLNKGGRISSLRNCRPVVDDHLLFTNPGGDASKPYCSLKMLQDVPALSDIAREIYEEQWVFPTALSSAIHLEFDPRFYRFPFRSKPEYVGSGGFGQVHGVEFEEGYIEAFKGCDKIVKVVYKKIRYDSEDEDGIKRITKEVTFLRARRHANISPLLASFTAGLEQSSNPEAITKCLYLVSPRAEMDMEKWFHEPPSYIHTFEKHESQDFNQHIYTAMRGLASGLAFIHRQIGYHVGYHGDLKPSNILKSESDGKLAWRISDFGTSNLKPIDDTRTQNMQTSLYWAPEEFLSTLTQREDGNHGRSHDVWSLGCVFLLLATMLVHRWEPGGIKAFKDLRERDAKDYLDHAFCNRMPEVREWIVKLRMDEQRKDFGQLLDLIEEMLQPQEARISSWEVAIDLPSISDPNRSVNEIVSHLKQVVQVAREADLEPGKHNPLTRARRDKERKSTEFRETLMENGWFDEDTTEKEKRNIMARRSLSTLPPSMPRDHAIGIETVLTTISERFKETSSLVLWGLGGVGKSLVALRHAEKLNEHLQQNSLPAQDVFWACASSIDEFDRTYTDIAAKLKADDPGFQTPQDRWTFVKSRLEEPSNKGWLMVIDGLDRYQELEVIERFLPKRGSGQILITTRNRHLVNNLICWRQMKAIIKMEYPGVPEAMELLKRYIGEASIATDLESSKQLVLQLKCPELIHDVSRYMVVRGKTCKDMLKVFKERRYEAIERIRPDFAEYLLSRALGVSLRDECEWSDELRLLILLCQFDNATGVHTRLIKVEFDIEEHPKVEEWLETLIACDFVWRDSDSNMYLVNPTVHLAMMIWLETHETSTHKLGRFNKMLSTLYRSYDRRKKKLDTEKRKDKQSKQPKSLEGIKASLMPHFKRFVEYARDAKARDPFVFNFRAVQAITLFSDVLLHENHYKDAISVLEFTQQYFQLGDLCRLWGGRQEKEEEEQRKDRQTRRRQRNAYFQLNLVLVKSYLFRPKGDAWLERLEKAQELVRRLQKEAASDDDTVLWGGKTLRAWNLDIELVRVLWKSHDFEAARAGLKNIRKIDFQFVDREAVLPSHHDAPYSSKDKQELQILAIRAKREQSLLELAHGDKHEYNGRQTKARSCWEAAYNACRDARIAVEQWSLTNNNIASEINEDRAKLLLRLGGKNNLDVAENIVLRVVYPANGETGMSVDGEAVATEIRRQSFGYMYKRKKLERLCLLYAIRLKRRELADLKEISGCLEQLVRAARENLGESHELSTACTQLLVDAYKATNQEQEAHELEKTLSITSQLEERSQWTRPQKRWRLESWGQVLGFVTFAAIALLVHYAGFLHRLKHL